MTLRLPLLAHREVIVKRRKPMLIDREATAAAGFIDSRSYIKRSRRTGDQLTFLFGLDMANLRRRKFDESKGFCQMPVNGVLGLRCNRNVTWETAELDHDPSLANGGDDTMEGTRIICRRCHVARHNRTTKWRNHAKAAI
jgi:hypothetical protein